MAPTSGRKARAWAWTFSGVPARIKRTSQGATAGRYCQRNDNGPSGSNSQPGTFHITPGIDIGVTEEALKAPALPNEAPWPGSPASIRNTWWPSRCR